MPATMADDSVTSSFIDLHRHKTCRLDQAASCIIGNCSQLQVAAPPHVCLQPQVTDPPNLHPLQHDRYRVPFGNAGAKQSWCGCCLLCWPPTLTSYLKPHTKPMPIGLLRMSCLDCWSRVTVSKLLPCSYPQVCLDLSAFGLRSGLSKESILLLKLIKFSNLQICSERH